ncbi:hypothetical protein ACFL6W_05875 [Thermodesulfobacteriota bacterium]
MSFWTFVGIIIIISIMGDALKKAFQGTRFKKTNEMTNQRIEALIRRIDELEGLADIRNIEKRVQALEAIVVDDDYILNSKFKKAMGE